MKYNCNECFTNSNDIVTNCLAIFDSVKSQKKYLQSSHGIARRKVDQLKDKALLAAELDDFAHCKDIH